MQKLAREYLDELNKRHKKNRRALVAWILMAVLVVGGVMGTLAQYGVAFEGSPECGKEEHTHDDGCYTETRELTCDLAEGEEHTHDDVCYTVSKELACELEEHSHEAGCYVEESKPDDTPQPNKTTPAESNGNTENPENPPVVTDKDTEPEDPQNPSAGTDDVTTPEDPQNPAAGTDDVMTPEDPQNPPTDTDDVTTPEDTQNPSDGTENGTEEGTVPDDSVETGTVSGNEVEAEFPPFEEKYSDDQVVITVSAEEGVIPAGAELKVVPVVKQDVEELEAKRDVAEEQIEEAKAINEKYEEVQKELEASVADDDTKEIAGFLAYDISFLVEDEEGNLIEKEPNGNVSVTMDFIEAAVPEEISEDVQIDSVDVVHMKETQEGLKAEKIEAAAVDTTVTDEIQKAEFVVDSFSVFTITWVKTEDGVLKTLESNVYIVKEEEGKYKPLDASFGTVSVASVGTPPTLYMDTITENGDNKGLYKIESNDETTYHFEQAFVVQQSGAVVDNTEFDTDTAIPITALQAMIEANNVGKIRYKQAGSGVFADVASDEYVLFVYSSREVTTTASYYTIDGRSLDAEDYNLSNLDQDSYVSMKQKPEGAQDEFSLDGTTFVYAYTEIKKTGESIIPLYMRYYANPDGSKTLQYRITQMTDTEEDEKSWLNVGTAEVRLIYRSDKTINTVDTSGLVDIDLFDYQHSQFPSMLMMDGYLAEDICDGLVFFVNHKSGESQEVWNKDQKVSESVPAITQGIVDSSLYKQDGNPTDANNNYMGYPRTKTITGNYNNERLQGSVLSALFDESYLTRYKYSDYQGYQEGTDVYTGLNHLFKKDDNGYYSYDSTENYAYFNADGNNRNFVVYDNSVLTGTNPSVSQFYPFESLNGFLKDTRTNMEDISNGQADAAFSRFPQRYHFGMHIGFNFTQPTGGMIGDAPMIFEFSGDDDVWVYIDGKLVLDLGGVHGKVTGSIDFKTGEVKIPNYVRVLQSNGSYIQKENGNTNLNSIFGWDVSQDTFADNTVHRLELFYLERGGWESNCSLKFNLQPQKPESIEVAKEITNTENAKYSNVDFDFKLYIENEVGSGQYDLMPENTKYTIKKDGEAVGYGTVGENGIFTLKHGESAVFEGIDAGIRYYVQEIGISGTEYNNVLVDGTTIKKLDASGKEIDAGTSILDMTFIAQTEEMYVGEAGKVMFKNECSEANRNELIITKAIQGSATDAIKGDRYTFKVYLEAQSDQDVSTLTEYKSGPYYLMDSELNYCKNNSNSPVSTNVTNINDAEVYGYSTANGEISNIPAGYSVVIPRLLSDTDFYVEEIGLDTLLDAEKNPKYNEYQKTVNQDTCSPGVAVIAGSETIADGAIKLNTDAKVTITNIPVGAQTIEYQWGIVKRSSSTHDLLEGAKFKLEKEGTTYYGLSRRDDPNTPGVNEAGRVEWYSDEDCSVLDELVIQPGDEYTLSEITAPNDYVLSDVKWKIIFDAEKNVPTITEVGTNNAISADDSGIFYFENDLLYELPSTGGSGIYRYMISGVLLMLAGVLILYNNKRARRCAGV